MARPQLPIAVVMQRRPATHLWDEARWVAVAVVPWQDLQRAVHPVAGAAADTRLITGLKLELSRDENEGYFENWVAPEPKLFVLWHEDSDDPLQVAASVSYAEGTRMLDSGDAAEGVPMPPEVHRWLGQYLQENYRPRRRGEREHG
jgi:hypothetical protein